MAIDDGTQQPNVPPHLDALATTGARPFPPTDESLKDYGPLSDTPTRAVTQSELDRRAAMSEDPSSFERITEGQTLSPLQASLRRLGRDRRAMVCLAVILMLVLLSYIFPIFYLHIGPTIPGGATGSQQIGPEIYHIYTHQELTNTNGPISAAYPLGTDQLGRDILARIMAGVNVSIEVALLVELLDISLGVSIGTLAGFFGGWVDTLLARFTDIMFAFPGLLLVIMAAATLGPIANQRLGTIGRLVVVALTLGITIWPQMARFVRGQTLQLKEQQFIEASRTVGGTNSRIIMQHIVPNLFSIVIAAATLNIVGTITAEAVVSLLGLGVNPPGSSLGLMISEGVATVSSYPGEVIYPSLVLTLLVVCFAFLGDGVRDAFDPRTKD